MKTNHFSSRVRSARTAVSSPSGSCRRTFVHASMILVAVSFWLNCLTQHASAVQVQWIASDTDTLTTAYTDGNNWFGGNVPGNSEAVEFAGDASLVFFGNQDTASASILVRNNRFSFASNPTRPAPTHTTTGDVVIESAGHLELGVDFNNAGNGEHNLNVGGDLKIESNGRLDIIVGSQVTAGDLEIVGAGSSVFVSNFSSVSANSIRVNAGRLNYQGILTNENLQVENGGEVRAGSGLIVGNAAGVQGSATFTGAGSSLTANRLNVGLLGTGNFIIEDGATAEVGGGFVTLGSQAGSNGTLTVRGAGTTFTATSRTQIGNNGTGTLNLEGGTYTTRDLIKGAGGTFNHTGGTLIVDGGTFDPGAGDYLTGIVHDTTASNITLRNEANANISGLLNVRTGDTLRIESGATINADSDVQVWGASRSFVVVEGIGSVLEGTNGIGVGFNALEGRLTVRDGGVARTDGNLSIGPEGQLSGDGTLEANTVTNRGLMDISGGFFRESVIGTLNIDGNFVQTSQGILEFDINVDESQIDLLSISGNATLEGTLDILGYPALPPGLELEILDIGGTRTGQFDGLAEGATVGNFGGADLMITYAGGDGNDVVLYTSSPTLLGDVDLSGTVDFLDIAPFIAVLSSGEFQAEADCDQSGEVNFLDIAPFIAILSGS